MRWSLSWRADPLVVPLADRHYNRHAPGADQFVPPGRCLVLRTPEASAFWVTSWQAHVSHRWPGAWVCSAFRNEGADLSSALIIEAVACTRWRWPDVPALGMVTFVNARKVRPKRDPGRCFRRAGFEHVGFTKDVGLYVLQLLPDAMPDAEPPIGAPLVLGGVA